MLKIIEDMTRLCRPMIVVKTPNEKAGLTRQIAATDARIDQLVYELYGLTDEEIAVIQNERSK